jgi:hypothetical protein
MTMWSDLHPDPRKSYYLFLRQGYGCPARVAHARVKQIDAMIMGLRDSPREARATSWLASVMCLLDLAGRGRMSLTRLWKNLTGAGAGSPKPENRLSSRFSQAR